MKESKGGTTFVMDREYWVECSVCKKKMYQVKYNGTAGSITKVFTGDLHRICAANDSQ